MDRQGLKHIHRVGHNEVSHLKFAGGLGKKFLVQGSKF